MDSVAANSNLSYKDGCSEIVLLVYVLIADLRCYWRILVLIHSFLLSKELHSGFMLCCKKCRTG